MNRQLFKEFITKALFVEGVGTSNLSTKQLDDLWNNFNHDDYREDNEYSYDDGPDLTLNDKMADIRHVVNKLIESKGGKLFGAGSGRETYILTSKLILKLAMNEKGLEQNKTETSVNKQFPDLTAKVYKVGPESYYLISELVRPLRTPSEFESMSGIDDWYTFEKIIKVMAKYDDHGLDNETISVETGFPIDRIEKCLNQPFVQLLLNMCDKGLAINDVPRIEHYGKTADGRIVLLDYGLSQDTWTNLYRYGDD